MSTENVIDPGTMIHADQVTADDGQDPMTTSRWQAFSRPPKEALRMIQGGRLKGMTDINPQWRYKAMDAAYGACGFGWRYEVTGTDRFICENGEILQFARVNVYTNISGVWSKAIPGSGGSKLCSMETSGLRYSDEAEKMAITDALSVALKFLGVASEIYEGRWDGSKYMDDATRTEDKRSCAENIKKPDTDPAIVKRLETCLSLSELQQEYGRLTVEQRRAHAHIKDATKDKLTSAADIRGSV